MQHKKKIYAINCHLPQDFVVFRLPFHHPIARLSAQKKKKTGANTKSLSSPGSSWCSSQSSVVELVIDRLMIVTGQQCQECEEGHEG